MKLTRLISFISLSLIPSATSVAQWEGIGFRGLELGMSPFDVWMLVKDTDWRWVNGSGEAHDERDGADACNDGTCLVLSGEKLGGEDPQPTLLKFSNRRLVSIATASRSFDSADARSAATYAGLLIEAVTKKYGEAYEQAPAYKTLVAKLPRGGVELARWEWAQTDAAGEPMNDAAALATLRVYTHRAEPGQAVWIVLEAADLSSDF